MKTLSKTFLIAALGATLITQTGCFGTFALTRKTYEFHDGITNSKFVKSLLYWIPGGLVYAATLFIDTIILNLIEFWSGSNPISMNEGDHEMQLVTYNGDEYRIDATKNTFTTTQLTGEKAGEVRVMKFDTETLTWKYTDSRVADQPIMTFLDDQANNVRVYTDNGYADMATIDLQHSATLAAKLSACAPEALACAE